MLHYQLKVPVQLAMEVEVVFVKGVFVDFLVLKTLDVQLEVGEHVLNVQKVKGVDLIVILEN